MSHRDPLDIRAQEKDEADRKEKQLRNSRQEAEDFKWLMQDKRGRRIVWRLLERTGIYRGGLRDSQSMAFDEGARNIGIAYMAMIDENCPERYAAMVTEQRDYDRSSNNRNDSNNGTSR
jgi:hypothetical protein